MPYHLPLCENSEIMKIDNTLCLLLFVESQNLKSEFGLIFTKKSVRFRYEFWKFESDRLTAHTGLGLNNKTHFIWGGLIDTRFYPSVVDYWYWFTHIPILNSFRFWFTFSF